MSPPTETSCRVPPQDVVQEGCALPVMWRTPSRSRRARLVASAVLLGCVVMWLGAWSLQPDPRGLGTHEQLGEPPCSWPVLYGLPCPTCGFTTAVAHAARFDWPAAFWAQPAGALLGLSMYTAAALACWVVLTGRGWQINWYRVRPAWVALVVLAVLVVAWGVKIITYRYAGMTAGVVS